MTKTMFDAAFLPNPAPTLFDVAAGYVYQVHGEAANIWTAADWHRATAVCRYLLPIATCWTPFGDGKADAVRAVSAWETMLRSLGMQPHPCAFALDMELRVATQPGATGYADAWRAGMRSLGYQDIVYSSSSGGHALGTGPLWLGPPAQPGMAWGNGPVLIAQQHYLGSIDTNTATDDVQFFDTVAPVSPPKPPVPPKPIDVQEKDVKYGLISCSPLGLGQFVGVFDAGVPVVGCEATVHGPDPHSIDPSSPDDLWPDTIGATVRAQVRGNTVVVTVNAPNAKAGTVPQVHVTAYV